jgi:hypothetical protein
VHRKVWNLEKENAKKFNHGGNELSKVDRHWHEKFRWVKTRIAKSQQVGWISSFRISFDITIEFYDQGFCKLRIKLLDGTILLI